MNYDYHVEITKRVKLREVCNDMCHNYYYLVYVRIYNANKTRFRRASFVVWFDSEDVGCHVDKDYYNKKDVMELLNDLIAADLDLIKSYNDTSDFYEFCNDSIKRYNSVYAA